jgi:hypothetical protein
MKTQKIRLTLLCAILALLLTPVWSAAGTFLCVGTVDDLYVRLDGDVMAKGSWRGTWTQFCNLEEEWKGVGTSTCFGWYNLLMTMQREGITAKVRYPDTAGTCETIGIGGSAEPPNYIMMK